MIPRLQKWLPARSLLRSFFRRKNEFCCIQFEKLKECCLLADQSEELEHNNKSLEVPFHVVQSRLSDDLILKKIEINENDEKGKEIEMK